MYLPDRNQSLQGTGENRMKRIIKNFVKTLRQDGYLRKVTKIEKVEADVMSNANKFCLMS